MTQTGQYHFICLDPRKTKRKTIADALRLLGSIRWHRIAPMRLRSNGQATVAAVQALAMSKERPRNAISRWLALALLRIQYNGAHALFSQNPDAVAVCWNGLNGTRRVFMQGARDAGARTLFFELAPLPDRITVDPCGVNFANGLPRAIAPYLEWQAQHGASDWRAAGRTIQQRAPNKPAAPTDTAPPLSDPFVFVPLQTPGDSQLRLFGGAFPTVETFITALIDAAKQLPQGWHIRLKEHPTAPESFRTMLAQATDVPIFFDNTTDTFAQVAASRGVITVNSSVGLEAMFYDKPVIACGQCFWAIPGVAQTAATPTALVDIMRNPAMMTFDPIARDAFMGFLTACYYPMAHDSGNLIAARLMGPDVHGFWGATT